MNIETHSLMLNHYYYGFGTVARGKFWNLAGASCEFPFNFKTHQGLSVSFFLILITSATMILFVRVLFPPLLFCNPLSLFFSLICAELN
ncbi:hypothetical protein RIF29_32565 [Crotalaria pallida]|uniref:Uncharacterized protein n=1 Tax=Crotalaria pallida TaxID=3830 RepID=A0AAN9HVV4_CROPI